MSCRDTIDVVHSKFAKMVQKGWVERTDDTGRTYYRLVNLLSVVPHRWSQWKGLEMVPRTGTSPDGMRTSKSATWIWLWTFCQAFCRRELWSWKSPTIGTSSAYLEMKLSCFLVLVQCIFPERSEGLLFLPDCKFRPCVTHSVSNHESDCARQKSRRLRLCWVKSARENV